MYIKPRDFWHNVIMYFLIIYRRCMILYSVMKTLQSNLSFHQISHVESTPQTLVMPHWRVLEFSPLPYSSCGILLKRVTVSDDNLTVLRLPCLGSGTFISHVLLLRIVLKSQFLG